MQKDLEEKRYQLLLLSVVVHLQRKLRVGQPTGVGFEPRLTDPELVSYIRDYSPLF
jgi:hypothetical protein